MRRQFEVVPAALCALGALACQPAYGLNDRQWTLTETPGRPALWYGTPDSDDIVIEFACPAGTGMVEITLAQVLAPFPDSESIPMEITVDLGENIVLEGTGEQLLIDDLFVITARTPMIARLETILTGEEMLAILVGDGTVEIPLDGAAAPAHELLSACAG